MVPKKLTSLLLGLLLAIVFFQHCIAHTHQVGTAVGSTSEKKELSDDDIVVAPVGEYSRIRGRKLMGLEKEPRKEMMKEGGVNGGSSEISGMADNASEKWYGMSQDGMNNIQVSKILKPKTSDSLTMESIGSSRQRSPEHDHPRTLLTTTNVSKAPSLIDRNFEPSSSEVVSVSQEPYHEIYQTRTVRSQRLLEDVDAIEEAMGMLNMDYKSPRRTPPINNDDPAADDLKHIKP